MSRQRLSRGVGAYALDKVVVAVVQLLSVPVLANAWGLSLYGTWAMIMTVPSFLLLGDFGIVTSAAARMIHFAARGQWEEARRSLQTAWLTASALMAIVIVAGIVILMALPAGIVPTADSLSDADSRATILILLGYGMLIIMCRLNGAALRADMHYSAAMLYSSGAYLAENLVVLVIAWLGYGLLIAAAGLLAARILVFAGQYILGMILVPRLRPGFAQATLHELRALFGPAMAATAMGFGTIVYLQGSVVMLGALAGPAAIPAFTAVRTLSRLGVQMATLISLPVSQEFAQGVSLGHEERSGKLFALVFFPALILAFGSSLGLALFGQPFIRMWTSDAIHADQALILTMAISSFAAMFWGPLSNLILAINRQQAFSYANIVASLAGLGIIYLLTPGYGSVAVGFSFLIVDTVTLIAVLVFIGRNWLPLNSFRRGIRLAVAELSSPRELLRSLRRTK